MTRQETSSSSPFNSAVESGLRTLTMLFALFPSAASVQRLIAFDYLLIHSDDVPGGPPGLHPRTPYRSGELLVRRDSLQRGIRMYVSRGLIGELYTESGLEVVATESAGSFLGAMRSAYSESLRQRAFWVADRFASQSDADIERFTREHLGDWGAEFEFESVLWGEDSK